MTEPLLGVYFGFSCVKQTLALSTPKVIIRVILTLTSNTRRLDEVLGWFNQSFVAIARRTSKHWIARLGSCIMAGIEVLTGGVCATATALRL